MKELNWSLLRVSLVLVACVVGSSGSVAWAEGNCCFTNRRFTGVCSVVPEPGQSCAGILSYLNNLGAVGKTYCGSTEIRMGWSLVGCDQAAQGTTGGVFGSPSTHRPQQPQNTQGMESYGTTGAVGTATPIAPQQPQIVEPGVAPVVIPSGMVMQVRMDESSVDGAWGQPVTASLTHDLIADGKVVAPAGAALRAWVSQPDPAVAADPSDLVLQLESVVVDGEEHPLVAEGSSGGAVAVSFPAALDKTDVDLGPATPLLPADETVTLTAESVQGYRQAIVAANLQLSELESVNFWPLYRAYRQEMEGVNARRFQLIQDFVASYESLAGEQAVSMLEESLAIEQQTLALKEGWLPRFREVLPDNKAVRFFQIENKLDTVVRAGLSELVPLVR